MRRCLIISVLVFIVLSICGHASAEVVTFTKEYTYQASEFDSKASSRTIALEFVKRQLLEEMGTFLISETEVKNMQLTKDQVTTYSAGIVFAEVIDEKWDGKNYWLKAKVSADPDEVSKSVERLLSNYEDRKALQSANDKIESLSKELVALRKDRDKWKEYASVVNGLTVNGLFQKGYALLATKQYKEAVKVFDDIIELDPKYVKAYNYRGASYDALQNYRKALDDFSKAIELDSKYTRAIANRAMMHISMKEYEKAIEGFSRVIEIGYGNDPDLDHKTATLYVAGNYYFRGRVYFLRAEYDKSIKEFNQALDMALPFTPKTSGPLNIDHMDKEFRLIPNRLNDQTILFYMSELYAFRGTAYVSIQNYDKGIEDLNNAIKIDPEFALPYGVRGASYLDLGKGNEGCADIKTACDLGVCQIGELAQYKKLFANGLPSNYMVLRQDLNSLGNLEREVLEAYAGVTGTNFRNDFITARVLETTVLPKYKALIQNLIKITPKTNELRRVHSLYIDMANCQLEGFTKEYIYNAT
ncbi:MAG: tetratricopeptide repeat protein [Nitrospirae bacterium]|nr:MAG: tetratricopeptide repeat protein [Nitrospirota bacterium]